MNISDNTLLILAVILFFGLIVPQFFRRLELSFATSLIILGSLLGPSGFAYIQPDETMTFFGLLGATFLMMLAGFRVETKYMKDNSKNLWVMGTLNCLLPFVAGTFITRMFDHDWTSSIFVGVVFISSSMMMVFANIDRLNLGKSKIGKIMKSMVVIQDLTALFMVFVIFKYAEPHQRYPLPILLGMLISSVMVLRMFVPEVVEFFFKRFKERKTGPESKVRLIIALLLFVIVIYSAIDVHPIVAAFLVGFSLSSVPNTMDVRNKLNTIGYGLFIPIFLFVIGIDLDLTILTRLDTQNYLLLSIVGGALIVKFLSGFIGGRILKHSNSESLMLGVSSSTQLTVTVSSSYAAYSMELIDNTIYSAIIMVSVIMTIINPIAMSLIYKHGNFQPEK